MCGIAGIYHYTDEPVAPQALKAMTEALAHRGPDDHGYLLLDTRRGAFRVGGDLPPQAQGGFNLGFGHQRLSIIDLSPAGRQPMSNDHQTLWMVYNGELYNYLELKYELEQQGYQFRSASDTEVVLKSYEAYGTECFARFNGMWALAIWDGRSRRLIVSRDRFGEKPLYFINDGRSFAFASEIKALLRLPGARRAPNERAIYTYLAYGYGYADVSNETFFEGVSRLEPAHYLMIREGQPVERHQYWQLRLPTTAMAITETEATDRFRVLLSDAVRLRMRADVRVGAYLSGGLDSSSVAVLAAELTGEPLQTVSLIYDDPQLDESRFVHAATAGGRFVSNFVQPTAQALQEDLPAMIRHQDEPMPALTGYAAWCLARRAKELGVRVLLSGHGGDELCFGYTQQYSFFFAELARQGRWGSLWREIRTFTAIHGEPIPKTVWDCLRLVASFHIPLGLRKRVRNFVMADRTALVPGFRRRYLAHLYECTPMETIPGYLNKCAYLLYQMSPIPVWLRVEDHNSMAFGIESRAPFLDHRLVEFGLSLPMQFKVNGGVAKPILRAAMRDRLPPEILTRYDKLGFPTPTTSWFRGPLKAFAEELFTSPSFRKRGYLNPKGVLAQFRAHVEGRADFRFKLWAWMNLELWFRRCVDEAP